MQQPLNRILIGFIAFCATLGAGLGIFLYVSLLPHIELIGWIVAALVVLGLGCTGWLLLAWTRSKVARLDNDSRVIRYGDYLVYKHDDGSFTHLSGIHQQMSLPPPVKVTEVPSDPRWDAVLDLRHDGKGMHAIAKDLKVPYNKIRTFLNQVEGNQSET